MGQVPYVVFIPCPSTIVSALDKLHKMHTSAQLFISELYEERFSVSATKHYVGVGSHSIRDAIIELINNEFERILKATNSDVAATTGVESAGMVLSVCEPSDKQEFRFSNLHSSILELAKQYNSDRAVSKVIIVCNCRNYEPTVKAKETLIQESKLDGKATEKYDYENFSTDDLVNDTQYWDELILRH